MKNIFKYMAVMAISIVGLSLTACEPEPEPEPTPEPVTYEESTAYAIYYEGQALTAGQTITITPTEAQIGLDDVEADLNMYNKTDNTLNTCFKVELVEGPESMGKDVPVCYGVCQMQQLPYTHAPISLAPGLDSRPVQLHVYMSMHEGINTGTYRITVGEGTELANPQVCNVKFVW